MREGPANRVTGEATSYNLVTFRLNQQVYALPIECVVQIIPMVTITTVPHASSSKAAEALLGVINVRGAAVPVLDLRCYLGLPVGKFQLYTPIILSRLDGRTIGMVVDEVLDVVHLAGYEVVPLSDIFPDGIGENPYLLGMARIGSSLTPLLEVNRLFKDLAASAAPAAGAAAFAALSGDLPERVALSQL